VHSLTQSLGGKTPCLGSSERKGGKKKMRGKKCLKLRDETRPRCLGQTPGLKKKEQILSELSYRANSQNSQLG